MSTEILTHSVDETRNQGAKIAATAQSGDVFGLIGDLGCGKTEFARGFIAAMCGSAAVRSPTFSIINIHDSVHFPIYHFDFYRLKNKEELVEIGYYDYVSQNGIVLIEWADMFPDVLPSHVKKIRFIDKGEKDRLIVIG